MGDPVGEHRNGDAGLGRKLDDLRPRPLVAPNRTGADRDDARLTIAPDQQRRLGVPRHDHRPGLHIHRQKIERGRHLPVPEREQVVVSGTGDRAIANAIFDQANGLCREQETQGLRGLAGALPVDHYQRESTVWPLDQLDGVTALPTGIFLRLRESKIHAQRFFCSHSRPPGVRSLLSVSLLSLIG